ncbi:MAG: 50S ribosomal protein L19 [Candidatus Pacebacteria bacterium]|nr:50S ribosomal protein L19 [Candidatus Paceibacterota bacterium]
MKSEIQFSPVNIEDRKKLGIRAGDTVRVWVKIQEKGKTRLQAFEGLVLAHKHGNESGASFTVRKVASGVGTERIFPLFSPAIDKIEIIKRSRVRRSKLYFIREKVARQIRRQMRKMKMMDLATKSDMEEADIKVKKEEQDKINADKAEQEIKEKTEETESKEEAKTASTEGSGVAKEDIKTEEPNSEAEETK